MMSSCQFDRHSDTGIRSLIIPSISIISIRIIAISG
jgi:hypothetical protein